RYCRLGVAPRALSRDRGRRSLFRKVSRAPLRTAICNTTWPVRSTTHHARTDSAGHYDASCAALPARSWRTPGFAIPLEPDYDSIFSRPIRLANASRTYCCERREKAEPNKQVAVVSPQGIVDMG